MGKTRHDIKKPRCIECKYHLPHIHNNTEHNTAQRSICTNEKIKNSNIKFTNSKRACCRYFIHK